MAVFELLLCFHIADGLCTAVHRPRTRWH